MTCLWLVWIALGASAPPTAAEPPRYPKLHVALYELREARKELDSIKGDPGGHKSRALAATDDAIRSVKLILAVKAEDTSPVKREKGFYSKWKSYPRIWAAVADLKEARTELQAAKEDFQGNKAQALQHIDEAVVELGGLLRALRGP